MDYHPLYLYRTFWGLPMINHTAYKMPRGRSRFTVLNMKSEESKLILQKCEEWLQVHMFEDEIESLDYRAVKHVTQYVWVDDRPEVF